MQKKWMDGITAAEKRHRGAAVAEWRGGLPATLRGAATRRIMASVLAACMMLTLLPVNAFAVQGDIPTSASSLACHTAHDSACGYVETIVTGGCTHTHDAACGYLEGNEGAPCNYTPSEGEESSAHVHDAACGYKEAVSPAACTHRHDPSCGYAEAVTVTSPCTHTCELCKVQDSSKPDESAAQCVCTALCTEDAKNAECAVCGVENADLSLCKGAAGDSDPGYADWLAKTQEILRKAQEAQTALNALSNEDKAAVGAERTAKLAALVNLSSMLPQAQLLSDTPTPTVGSQVIYANGVPLLLVQGTLGAAYTVIYIDKNNNGKKDDGDTIFTGLDNDSETGNDLSNYDIYGGGVDADFIGDIKITITGGTVKNVYGGGVAGNGSTANVTKTATVTVNGGTVSQNVYGGGNATNSGAATAGSTGVTVGGGAKIGDDSSYGVVINGGDPTKVTNGVDSFVINPDLSADASVGVKLPAGYEATAPKTIATDAVQDDLDKIKLTGDGAAGKKVYFENSAIEVKAIPLTGTVTISGKLQCNERLTATVDNSNNTGVLSYQWKRGGVAGTNIGGNSNTYTPVAADVGFTIACVVTSSAQGGNIYGTTTGSISKMESPDAPNATFAFDGVNANKLMGTTTAMQYSLDGGNTWTDCTAPSTDLTSVMNSINENNGIQLRVKETATQQVGAVREFKFSKGGTVSGVSVQGCTTSDNNDGRLLGVTPAMEYQKVGKSDWTSGTGSAITGLTSGNYLVRIKAAGMVLAGNSTSFTVAEYSATPSYGISLSETGTHTFVGADIGYSEQTLLTVQIGNSGNQPTGQLTVQLTGANRDSFTLSSQSIGSIAVNGGASFTVKPKINLAAGTYTATVTVSGGNRISESFNVSFTVIDTRPTVTSVAVSPSATGVQKGTTQQFTVTVQGANNPAQTVAWEIVGSHAAGTSINTSGLLTVAADETQATLTVKATSTVNTSKSGTATVTVTDQPVVKYTLTVVNGTGGGNYAVNAAVPITANAPENNKVFDKWITSNGGSFASETSATTQFTMPAGAVTVTATYKVDTVSIDTAIAAANTAKSGIAVNNNPTSSVASGTKFVTSAEMDALNAAIATAQAEKSAATTPQQVQAAADKLNNAVAAFNRAIKTGTYTSNSGGNSGSGGSSSGSNGNNSSGGGSNGNSSGGNSSGGSNGSNGSSGGTSSTAGTLPENMPNVPATAEINVTAKTDDKGNTVVDLPNKAVDDAIDKALDAAKKNGTERNGVSVQVNVNTGTSPTGKAADSITVSFPKATQERLIEGRVDRFTLVINQPDIAISLDLDAIRAINAQAKTDAQLTVTRITDTSELSAEARAAAGDRPVFRLEASYQDGTITGLAGGDITLEIPYQLETGEQAGSLYLVYIDEQGKAHFITDSSYDAQRGVLMGITGPYALYCVGYKTPTVTFSDIQNHWAKENIEFAASRELLAGTGAGKFSPDAAITRGMLVAALGRLAEINQTQYKNTKFTDVAADAYYAPYAVWAIEKGIVSLTDATIFAPDTKISREEMAVIMANYAKATGYTAPKTREAVTFVDSSSIASKARNAVKAMQMAGIVNGKDGNRFDPKAFATRAEVSAALHRYVELVINPVTAQGLDVNDSGSAMLWERGKMVKSQRRTVDGNIYAFNGYGEAALPVSDKKQMTPSEQKE